MVENESESLPRIEAFATRPVTTRSGFLDTPSSDSKSEFAYTGGTLERVVFITPAFISILMISFVTLWGARLSRALTVTFICCYISYGWVKGIHSALFALFVCQVHCPRKLPAAPPQRLAPWAWCAPCERAGILRTKVLPRFLTRHTPKTTGG